MMLLNSSGHPRKQSWMTVSIAVSTHFFDFLVSFSSLNDWLQLLNGPIRSCKYIIASAMQMGAPQQASLQTDLFGTLHE